MYVPQVYDFDKKVQRVRQRVEAAHQWGLLPSVPKYIRKHLTAMRLVISEMYSTIIEVQSTKERAFCRKSYFMLCRAYLHIAKQYKP